MEIQEAYRALFRENEVGKEVLTHILKTGHVWSSTFVKGDPHESALKEGERRMALSILRAAYREVITDDELDEILALSHERTTSPNEPYTASG